jgi:hypothetical protein
MAGMTDDPDDAAARLEAALERIALHAAARPGASPSPAAAAPGAGANGPGYAPLTARGDPSEELSAEMTGPAAPVEEIAARLDGLIDRLRAALTTSSGGRPG